MQAVSDRSGSISRRINWRSPACDIELAFNLAYDGAPLAEDRLHRRRRRAGAVLRDRQRQSGRAPRNVAREGVSYATWSRGGKSYMFVARMPERKVADLAQTLVGRF